MNVLQALWGSGVLVGVARAAGGSTMAPQDGP